MKIVYSANNSLEANIVAGMLRANGIEAATSGDFLQGGVGELAAQGFAQVLVADVDFDQAKQLVKEYDDSSE